MIETGQLLVFDRKVHGEKSIMRVTSVKRQTGALSKTTDFWVVAQAINGSFGHKSTVQNIEYMISCGEVTLIDAEYNHLVELLFK